MGKWLIENKIGNKPLFISKGREKQLLTQKIEEKECCALTFTAIDLPENTWASWGYIKTTRGNIPLSLELFKPIVLFSCFDEIVLNVFHFGATNTVRLYRLKMHCCKNFHLARVKAYSVGLFSSDNFMDTGEEYIELTCKIENLRDNDEYHYSIKKEEHETQPHMVVDFQGEKYNTEKNMCIFCLQNYGSMEALNSHINNFHFYYQSEIIKDKEHYLKIIELEHPMENDISIAGSIVFLKRRGDKPIDYRIKDYGPLINREYENMDYSEALAAHVNSRIHGANDVEEGIMKEWNKLRIMDNNIENVFYGVLYKYGLVPEVVRLIEILYRSSIFNTEEICNLLEKYRKEVK
ncbi:hypothetical protein ENBRE01_0740 [Enteropsectra breve]|nr:hypothetical protein ENBRE01_0740 [Enteropsectra breve]